MQTCYYVRCYVAGVCRHVIMLDVMLQVYADMLYVGYYVTGVCRHVIMLDVDSKDVTVGLSCPPQPFVDLTFLQKIKQALHTGGE